MRHQESLEAVGKLFDEHCPTGRVPHLGAQGGMVASMSGGASPLRTGSETLDEQA